MFEIRELVIEQRRQYLDVKQVFEAYEAKRRQVDHNFDGSMRWAERNGTEYLLRKRRRTEKSLGPRSPETERMFRQFMEGREQTVENLKAIFSRMEMLAPMSVAVGINRVPRLTARLLRRLEDARLLGSHLHVVGTNALFAYEAACGVRIESGLLATGDADLLMDARRNLRLAVEDIREEGVLGIIRKVDRSFAPRGDGDYRAINKDGFYVDLIRPQVRNAVGDRSRDRIGRSERDLRGAPIRGLDWLVSAPKFTAVAIDEGGLPVRIRTIDPRAFALHKAWVSEKVDRDPVKKNRDWGQAAVVARLAVDYLNLPFDSDDLSALPLELRQQADRLAAAMPAPQRADTGFEPKGW